MREAATGTIVGSVMRAISLCGSWLRGAALCVSALAVLQAQAGAPVVVDPSGLALPGATVRLLQGATLVASVVTGADGSFRFDPGLAGTTFEVVLSGFETVRVPRTATGRISLPLAHTAEVTSVVAPIGAADSPSSAAVGGTLTATTVARLPSKQMKAKESLPLLPSVIRGADGLMHVGGATAHDAPVTLDGFNITDPSTGLSSLNLPYETVRGLEVLRDPMAMTYSHLLAGVVSMESRSGGDTRRIGVQGVVPRPRFASPGFGRLEGIFPRFYIDGPLGDGRTRYATAIEYDYERIPVPGVTQGQGPDTVERGTTLFARVDRHVREHQVTTVEGFVYDSGSGSQGLGPRRQDEATTDLRARDSFVGLIHRVAFNATNVLTLRFGVIAHRTSINPKGEGQALLSPAGWSGNWFARASRAAVRSTASVTWDWVRTVAGRLHEFTATGDVAYARASGQIDERSVLAIDANGALVRSVTFGPPATFGASDEPMGAAVRDVWHATPRLDVDAGARVDYSRYGGTAPSARAGVRYGLTADGDTVLRLGYGSFVGSLPLAVPAFGGYPIRTDQYWDPITQTSLRQVHLTPTVGVLGQPHAVAATASVERRLRSGLNAQVSFTDRRSSNLARLRVPEEDGGLVVESTGTARYRELQLSGRQTWAGNQELFVSYVLSTATGPLNEFTSLYQGLAVPLLQPGGITAIADDAPHRLIAWGTVNLPHRVVVSPVLEWRSGFRYSVFDERHLYVGQPNSRRFPPFVALDLVVYKTVTVRERSADLGVQIFNVTNHKNPRDVYETMGEPRFGTFTNSVGTIVRGYMMVKW